MFMLKQRLYKRNGESRELPLDELHEAHTALAEAVRYKYTYPVLRGEGAATRSKAKKFAKEDASRAQKIDNLVPSIDKHLEALPLMLAEAEKEGAGAAALWTMQCDAGCQTVKDNMACLFTHKQCFVCHSASPPITPYGSPRSD